MKSQRAPARFAAVITRGVRRIARNHFDAFLASGFGNLLAFLDDKIRLVLRAETCAENTADAAIADNGGVVGKRGDRQILLLFLGWRSGEDRAVGDLQPFLQVGDRHEIKWIDEDRDDRAGENEILPLLRQKFQGKPKARENE